MRPAYVIVESPATPQGQDAAAWLVNYAGEVERSTVRCSGADAWFDTTVDGTSARRLDTVCDRAISGNPAPFTEVAWVVDGTAWVLIGNTPMVDLMLPTLRVP